MNFILPLWQKSKKISSLIDINLIMNSEALKSRCRQEWHLPISVETDSVSLFAAFLKLIAYSWSHTLSSKLTRQTFLISLTRVSASISFPYWSSYLPLLRTLVIMLDLPRWSSYFSGFNLILTTKSFCHMFHGFRGLGFKFLWGMVLSHLPQRWSW